MRRAIVVAASIAIFASIACAGETGIVVTPGVDPNVLQARCAEHVFLSTLEDREGLVGGYIVNIDILDSPVEYLDAHGKHLATFHIFAPDAEREAATKVINRYTKRFPLQKRLDCSPFIAAHPKSAKRD